MCYTVPLFDLGLHILPQYPLPQGQERRPSATPGAGPTPCGAASLQSHMESRGFHSPQTSPLLSAPASEHEETRGISGIEQWHTSCIQEQILKLADYICSSKHLCLLAQWSTTHPVTVIRGKYPQLRHETVITVILI